MATADSEREPRRGRRRGDDTTRDAILDAALVAFAEEGFDRATMRSIAAAAGVDPGMIRHWFGDKDGLFIATVIDRTPTVDRLRSALEDTGPGKGRRFADAYLGLWEDEHSGPILRALLRSGVATPRALEILRRVLGGDMVDQADAGDVRTRGLALAGSHVLGVAITRYVLRIELIATMPRDALLDELGPVLDGYLHRG
ncbi:TetR/AcrR family transcriptional regulator [Demequina sp. NBRC 110057]|uniref:TetR/AcrR family transcriptional regulator n=1 Tax=Demequina sp. NBRC 110057 TaxID=1570346 RepID=UPI0009FDBDD7|nr:TetR family transcriptional regulator [Demequina sp. NBRC 110057]